MAAAIETGRDADVFDALTHRRVYKPAWPVAEIERQSGRQFDPRVVEAFGRVLLGAAGQMISAE